MVKVVTELLATEDKVDRAARTKIRTIKRDIGEGYRRVGCAPQAVLRRGVEEARHRSELESQGAPSMQARYS
ncbi:MAG: hypothetical protein WDO18_12850 [Acidobacteriota bacterium]